MKNNIPFNVGNRPAANGDLTPPFDAILEGARAGKAGGFRNPRTWGVLFLAGIVAASLWIWNLGESAPDVAVLSEELSPMHQGPLAEEWLADPEVFVVASQSPTFLQTTSGLGLSIPENAFDTDNDSVTIALTYYNDAFKVFASGIPMTYDSAGTTYHFQSDGMVRIEAFANGIPAALVPGNELLLELPVQNDSTHFGQYELDEKNGQWTYLRPSVPVTYAQACKERPTTQAATPITHAPSVGAGAHLLADIAALEIERMRLKRNTPQEPVEFNPNQDHFTLDMLTSEFPQLASFSDMEFEVRGPGFRPDFFDQLWDDFRLDPLPNSPFYQVTLSGDGKTQQFKVVPVVRAEAFAAAFADYQRKHESHATKQAACEHTLLAKQTALEAVQKQADERSNLQASASSMLMNNLVSEMEAGSLVYRFAIGSLGVVNVDHPMAVSATRAVPVDVVVRYNDRVIRPIEATHCDVERMQFYALKGEELDVLRWKKNGTNMMMASLDGNQVFVATPKMFDALHKKADTYQALELLVVQRPVKNMEELLDQLDLSDTSAAPLTP